ncbi:WAT1-related protein At3g28050-like [Glycine soja]|nr:WAT1-related protein At3g28050-like [Glycine soja]
MTPLKALSNQKFGDETFGSSNVGLLTGDSAVNKDAQLLTLFKEATLQGMNNHVFVAYTSVVATTLLFPISFFSRKSRVVPTLSFSIASKMILIGMIGTSCHIMYYVGVSYSSPTLASSIANLGPAFTFILAIIFRMEKIAAKSRSSQAKVIGSIISIARAFVLTLYKSPSIIKAHSHDLSLPLQQPFSFLKSRDADWVIAGTCLESRTEYFINLHCLHCKIPF